MNGSMIGAIVDAGLRLIHRQPRMPNAGRTWPVRGYSGGVAERSGALTNPPGRSGGPSRW